jgi:hypothetical protein
MTENMIFTLCRKNPILRHIKSNNSGTAKVKIFKKERDPPLFTSKQLKRGGSLSFLVRTIGNVLVMEIGWTDGGAGGIS